MSRGEWTEKRGPEADAIATGRAVLRARTIFVIRTSPRYGPAHPMRGDRRKRPANRKAERMASLQARLDEYKKSFEAGAPPYHAPREVIETMHRATAELKASGAEGHALKAGDRAPGFTLFNQEHAEVASAALLREGPLVVGFFRGHW